jgi:hypothetical protein
MLLAYVWVMAPGPLLLLTKRPYEPSALVPAYVLVAER